MKKINIFSGVLMLLGIGYVIAAFYPLVKFLLSQYKNEHAEPESEWVEDPMLIEE